MRVSRLQVTAYRGIQHLDAQIPPAGIMVTGTNDQGKSTVLRAIQAALAGRDIGPEAIRLGSDRAEILVDIDNLRVRRIIDPDGSKVSVERDMGDVRPKVPSPAKFLKDLMGVSGIDPIDLISAKTAEERRARRAKVLSAIPAHVTVQQIEAWTGEIVRGSVDPTTHGLEVIAQLRTAYYERRKDANAKAKDGRRRASETAAEVARLPVWADDVPTVEDAIVAKEAAARELAQLEARAKAAMEAEARTRSTRARVDDLRRRSAAEINGLTDPSAAELERGESSVRAWSARVAELEAELADARDALSKAELFVRTTRARCEQIATARRRSEDLARQASELESAISAASISAPTEAELQRARDVVAGAEQSHRLASEHEQHDCLRQQAFDAEQAAKAQEAEAERLDRIVQTLTKDAPAELLASADAVPGLTIDGDQIFLDGVDLDSLCGRQQLEFAIAIAKRANAKGRILICDGLERIAKDQLEDFVRMATAGGYQLLCTRVTEGSRVIEALEPGEVSP